MFIMLQVTNGFEIVLCN